MPGRRPGPALPGGRSPGGRAATPLALPHRPGHRPCSSSMVHGGRRYPRRCPAFRLLFRGHAPAGLLRSRATWPMPPPTKWPPGCATTGPTHRGPGRRQHAAPGLRAAARPPHALGPRPRLGDRRARRAPHHPDYNSGMIRRSLFDHVPSETLPSRAVDRRHRRRSRRLRGRTGPLPAPGPWRPAARPGRAGRGRRWAHRVALPGHGGSGGDAPGLRGQLGAAVCRRGASPPPCRC